LNIQVLQGNAATHLRRGGKFYSVFFCSSSQNAGEKEINVGPRLPKLLQKDCIGVFLTHGVDAP